MNDSTTKTIEAIRAIEPTKDAIWVFQDGKLKPINISMLQLHALADRLAMYEEALGKIACLGDAGGNVHLRKTGSYSQFDEPVSVEIARESLKGDSK